MKVEFKENNTLHIISENFCENIALNFWFENNFIIKKSKKNLLNTSCGTKIVEFKELKIDIEKILIGEKI
jgi:hypothetical protein